VSLVMAISPTPTDVPGLVRLARDGDHRAFGELHRRYAGMVHAVLLARAPSDVADDLVQDVFLAAWQRITQLKEPARFGGWIGQIARNKAVDHARRPARRVVELDPNRGQLQPPIAEANEALRHILALPETYRENLLMRLVEGMTGPEIAEQTGMTHGSVRVNLTRGMKLLRERLGGSE
jgi:RNA polymerase sigma-70 factor, ECF subfamily